MNENTKEKTIEVVGKIASDLEWIAKKGIIFNASTKAMLQSEQFEKFDFEFQFMEIATVLRNTAERVEAVLKDFKED